MMYARNNFWKTKSKSSNRSGVKMNCEEATCHCPRHTFGCRQNISRPLITFRGLDGHKQNIILGKKVGKFGHSDVFLGKDASSGELNAIFNMVANWRTLDITKANKIDMIVKLRRYLKLLLSLKHPLLCQYKGWHYTSTSKKVRVYILVEYCGGSSLSAVFKKNCDHKLPLELVRMYTHELLRALEYLHHHSLAHRNLTVSNVFLNQNGKLKLAGYGLTKRIRDMCKHFSFNMTDKREDVYCLGLMISSLLIEEAQVKNKTVVPEHFPDVLKDFLSRCLDIHKFPHLTIQELLHHEFISKHFPQTLALKIKSERRKNSLEQSCSLYADQKERNVTLVPCSTNRSSRLHSEFEIIKVLGKGGFGDVLKVRNKIDGGLYAIKKIVLNPKSKKFNDKMLREVKLLSQMKHEHVVRYYCSWIEVSSNSAWSGSSSNQSFSIDPTTSLKEELTMPHNSVKTKASLLSNFDFFRDVNNLLPNSQDEPVEWLISFDSLEVETIGKDYLEDEVNEEFEHRKEISIENNPLKNSAPKIVCDADLTIKEQTEQILFIQMECCDERTLRDTIDDGLCKNKERIWRLFREIIEGLVHIHEKEIIHRDLKPVNIFLDSCDHVKIGDFGLARTDIAFKNYEVYDRVTRQDLDNSLSEDSASDKSLTGAVGTVYYVSPEVMSHPSKSYYGQKVDMYSLGVIFFEMCYRSLPTEHERAIILNNLRHPTIIFPQDFNATENALQIKIIRWLLAHNPKMRPTSKELLSSSLIPVSAKHETELSQILHSAIYYPKSICHNQMLTAIFNQKISEEQERDYDFAAYENMITWRTSLLYQQMKSAITTVFINHGAIHIPLPLFMPKCNVYDEDVPLVKVMNSKGGIVSIPMDQRVSFARFVGRKNICSLKRFSIEKVFREKKCHDVHPAELTECAFDVVYTSDSLIADSEVLIIVQEILNQYPSLQARKMCVKINHMFLLKALLLFCGISENMHHQILNILAETKVGALRSVSLEKLAGIKLSETVFSKLNSYLDIEGSLHSVACSLTPVTSLQSKVGLMAKAALESIKTIISFATYMGFDLQIKVSLNLIFKPSLYSGVMYQVVCDQSKNGKSEALAVGGRYDKLIENFMLPAQKEISGGQVHGVGISLMLEHLAVVIAEDKQFLKLSPYDFLVCSLGNSDMTNEKLIVVKKLWDAGLKSDVLVEKSEEMTDVINKCLYKEVSYIVSVIKTKPLTVQVYSLDQEPVVTRTMVIDELIGYIQKKQMETLTGPQAETPWHEICSLDTSWTDI
ncbi:eukaryotic translation initiation factor 2-alpha kinase 4 [Biomphalaria glabrata]|nr:eukaryotic translation initiation factor 2-alpha kinase 4 [Biomphalaria glabrata]